MFDNKFKCPVNFFFVFSYVKLRLKVYKIHTSLIRIKKLYIFDSIEKKLLYSYYNNLKVL